MADESSLHTTISKDKDSVRPKTDIELFIESQPRLSLHMLADEFPNFNLQSALGSFYKNFTTSSSENSEQMEAVNSICDNYIRNDKYSSQEVDKFRNLNLYKNTFSATDYSFHSAINSDPESSTRRAIEFTLELYRDLRTKGYSHEELCG